MLIIYYFFRSQQMFEGGFGMLLFRPPHIIPLILRLIHPDLVEQICFYEEITPINDTKGIFVLLTLNSLTAVLIAGCQITKKHRAFRKVSRRYLANRQKSVAKENV